jgi:hypothetical protein
MTCHRLLLRCLWPLAGLAGCGSHHDDPAVPQGQLVVGVQAEELGAYVGQVHLVVKVDGAVASDQRVSLPGGLPKEIPVSGAPGAKVDVEVDGFAPTAPQGPPAVTRLAGAHLASGPTKKLLRVVLEQRCTAIEAPGAPPPPVTCAAPLTCIGGGCASSDVPDAALEDYDPQWASAPPDICRPAQHGAPEVIVGTGQTDYLPLTDGQMLQMELGPQGGHHIWVATRMRNLRQSGSTTTLTATVEGGTDAIPPAAFVFTFDQDEGNYCKLYGLRFQLDSGAADLKNAYKVFLGKTIDVSVTVADTTHATGTGTKRIVLGTTLICPDGTNSCNL